MTAWIGIWAALLVLCAGALTLFSQMLRKEREAKKELTERLLQLERERTTAQEKSQWVNEAESALREAFQALSAKALQENTSSFSEKARSELSEFYKRMEGGWGLQREQFQNIIAPLKEHLTALQTEVRTLEAKRATIFGSLEEQLRTLQTTTGELERALKTPSSKGNWGELALQRIVELAGLSQHIDFDVQKGVGEFRPDMVVKLPSRGAIPIDAKVSLSHYQAALAAKSSGEAETALKQHLKAVQDQIQGLTKKEYWDACRKRYGEALEFVVMFVPIEGSLSAAFAQDPTLFERALQQHVLITSPATLLALLKAIAYGWQQQELAENAKEIQRLAQELEDRFVSFLKHFQALKDKLQGAVESFNAAVGSYEKRLAPTLHKFQELKGKGDLPTIEPLEKLPRNLEAPREEREEAEETSRDSDP